MSTVIAISIPLLPAYLHKVRVSPDLGKAREFPNKGMLRAILSFHDPSKTAKTFAVDIELAQLYHQVKSCTTTCLFLYSSSFCFFFSYYFVSSSYFFEFLCILFFSCLFFFFFFLFLFNFFLVSLFVSFFSSIFCFPVPFNHQVPQPIADQCGGTLVRSSK